MVPRRAVAVALLGAMAVFAVQLLWTRGVLEDLEQRAVRRRNRVKSQSHRHQLSEQAVAASRGSRLNSLARPQLTGASTTGSSGSQDDGSGKDEVMCGLDRVKCGDKGASGSKAAGEAASNDLGDSSSGAVAAVADPSYRMPNPAIIVFCYNRPGYLNQTLRSLLDLDGLADYSVYVSQDGNDGGVADLVASLGPHFLRASRGFAFWQKHPRTPLLTAQQAGHAWLAQHYKWGLDRVFQEQGHSHVIILEDDMLLSPDFLHYFRATAPLLEADPTLWCVSSWNDNGFVTWHDWDVRRLFRTSYFPGLGWMMKRQLWLELGPKWPLDHWDHWMRDEEVSRGRDCIAPEVNRNRNIGEVGANMNKQAFRRFLKNMGWNQNETVRDFGNLSHLLAPAYTASLRRSIAEATPWELSYRLNAPRPKPGGTYLLPYTIEQYTRIALRLKLWPYPRGHHQHVADIPWMGARFLLADRRFCPLLPPEQRLLPMPGMTALPGGRWQSCNDVCAAAGMRCHAKDFWWLNSCSVMRRHFPCEHGCTVELGPDVPAYVEDSNQTLHKYCLITQKPSTCQAKHAATARLCACIPVVSAEDASEQQRQQQVQAAADTLSLPTHKAAGQQQAAVAAGSGGSAGKSSSSSSDTGTAIAADTALGSGQQL